MNYSGSKRLIEILSAVKDAVRNGRIDGVAAELQYETAMLTNKHAHMADTPYSWGPTEAERDYLYRLKRLYHAVQDVSVQELPAWLEAEEKDVVRRMPKPKVAFFTQEFGLWPSFDSIWENYDGEKVDKELVFVYYEGEMTPDLAAKKNTELTAYIKAGYDPIPSEDYDFSKASPDIVYYMKPYKWRGCSDKFFAAEISKHTPYTVFSLYCLVIQGGDFINRFFYGEPAYYYMWKIIGYSRNYVEMFKKHGFRNAENVVRLGHPKFDSAKDVTSGDKYIRRDWREKIAGRPVILWNTHFSVGQNIGVGTFFQWKDVMFDYFAKHDDVVLLWRPHPLFWESVKKEPGVDGREFDQFVKEMAEQGNIIVDAHGDYRCSFAMSDALISDATTFLGEYNATGRPVLYTPKKGGAGVCDEAFIRGLYVAEDQKGITEFIENTKAGLDPLREERIAAFIDEFGEDALNGCVGENVVKYITEEFERDIHDRVAETYRKEEACHA